jgi:hypothetical protein
VNGKNPILKFAGTQAKVCDDCHLMMAFDDDIF